MILFFIWEFTSSDPETIAQPTHHEDRTIQTLRQLSKINAGRHEMEQVSIRGLISRIRTPYM